MEIMKLKHHQASQCKVVIKEELIVFVSYTTPVIYAELTENGTYNLTCTGTYSPTTRKQIGWFLEEYFGDVNYYQMKKIAGTGEYVNAIKQHAKYW